MMIGAGELSDSTCPFDEPLIVKTLKKPFLPGNQVFALYKEHVVIAIVRGPLDFPEEIYAPKWPDAWRTLPQLRRVAVLSLSDVEWIQSYERGFGTDASVKLTLLYKGVKFSALLPEEEGTLALKYLAENFGDKLEPKAESARDSRRKETWTLVFICLLLDGWVAWALWELWNSHSLTGPAFLVDIIWRIYETRGFPTAALVLVVGAAFFNLMLLALSFLTPATKARTLNCSNCGYQLRGLRSGVCPECGTTTSNSTTPRSQPDRR